MTLMEFLLARIDEEDVEIPEVIAGWNRYWSDVMVQAARDALATLGEMLIKQGQALRVVITEHAPMRSPYIDFEHCRICVGPDGWPLVATEALMGVSYPCPTLLALAQPYVDHADFDPAWAVT